MTNLYARISKHSKYYETQKTPKPFAVEISASDCGYIFIGNQNRYRACDLDLYVNVSGDYIGVAQHAHENVIRYLEEISEMIKDEPEINRYYIGEAGDIRSKLESLLSLLPADEPKNHHNLTV